MADKIRRQALSVQENEELAEAVRKYPCLYNKSKTEYKDKIVTSNAWKEVADQLHFINNATRAKLCFENLKKNYTKKRSNVRSSKTSGTSREAVEKAENELNQLSFLVWLDDFIRPRNSRSSFDEKNSATNKPSDDESVDGGGFGHSTFNQNDFEEQEASHADENCSLSPGVTNEPSSGVITNELPSGVNNDLPLHSKTNLQATKTPVPPKRRLGGTKEMDINKQKLSFLKNISQRMETRDQKKQKTEDAEDRYATTIADKLRDLPPRERLLAKHDIENTLFQYQLQALDKENTVLVNNTSVHQFPLQQTHPLYQNNEQQNNFGNQNNQAGQPINLSNQPISPSYSTLTMPSPSYPYIATQDGERSYENL